MSDKRLAFLEQTVAAGSTDPLALYGLAQEYRGRGRFDDALAVDGVLFRQAYVQAPVCGASRASMLTGLRPTHGRFVSFDTRVDRDVPGVPTIADLLHGAQPRQP